MSQRPKLSIADKQAFFDGMPKPMLEIRQQMRERYGIPKEDGIKYNYYVNEIVSRQRGNTDLIRRLRAASTIPDDRYKAHEASSNIMSCFERGSEAVASIVPESDPKNIRDHDRAFWSEGMNDSKTRNYFFEAARRHNFMPELYFLFNTHDSYASEGAIAHLIAWCKKEGLDLDQIVDNYELPEMDNLDAIIQTGYEARPNAAVHPVNFNPSSDLVIRRRDDGSIELDYPGLETEIVDGDSSPESLMARAVMRKAQATGGIIGADVITANTIADKQRFFSEVDANVLFRSFAAARDLDHSRLNDYINTSAGKIAAVKSENTAYASIKASDDLDAPSDYRWAEFMTQMFMSTKRGSDNSVQYAATIGFKVAKNTYSNSWRNNMSQPRVRDRIFEIIHKNDLIPEFYFIINAADTHLKSAHQRQLVEWCERNGIDLDTLLGEYELEGIIQNPQPDSDLVVDANTAIPYAEPSQELKSPNPKLIAALTDHYRRPFDEDATPAEREQERVLGYVEIANKFGLDSSLYYGEMTTADEEDVRAVKPAHSDFGAKAEDAYRLTIEGHQNPDQDSFNLYADYISGNLRQSLRDLVAAIHGVSLDDSTLPDIDKAINDNLVYNPSKIGEEAQDSIFERLDAYGLMPLLEHALACDEEHETAISHDELKASLEAWTGKPFSAQKRFLDITHPTVNQSLIHAMYDHFYDDYAVSGTFEMIGADKQRLNGLHDITAEFGIEGLDFTTEVKIGAKGNIVESREEQKRFEDRLKSLDKRLIIGLEEPDRDAYLIYMHLISPNQEFSYIGSNAQYKDQEALDRGLSASRRGVRKTFYKDLTTPQLQGIFDRIERYGMMPMFKHLLSCDGAHKTTLPARDLQRKLETWEKIQTRRAQQDQASNKADAKQEERKTEVPKEASGQTQGNTPITAIPFDGDAIVDPIIGDDQSLLDKQEAYNACSASSYDQGLMRKFGVSEDEYQSYQKTFEEKKSHLDRKMRYLASCITAGDKVPANDNVKSTVLSAWLNGTSNEQIEREIFEEHGDDWERELETITQSKKNHWIDAMETPASRNTIFKTFKRLGILADFYFFAGRPDTLMPANARKQLRAWCENKGVNLRQILIDHEVPIAPEVDEYALELERDAKPEKAPVEEPESETYLNFEKKTDVTHSPDGGDVYEEYRRRAIQRDKDKYATLSETDISEPYNAHDNAVRDIPRIYVPDLLPEGNSDHEGALELTGDFTGAGGRRGKRQVIIQEERRDLIVEALKLNPQVDSTTIREYTHPEFNTAEGLYYTVIHAETYDGNWTQIAVSTAKGDGVFLDKHRQIVEPITGRSRLGISDLREDLLIQRIKYAEDHPDNYQTRIDEISTMSPDDVPESTKTAIQWEKLRKYGDKVSNQIHSSYAEHIRKYGEGVACEGKETSELIIKTGDMRESPDDEHPSLIFRTRWDRVVSSVREGKVTGLGHIAYSDKGNTEAARKQVEKELLQWVVDNDPTNELFDCLRSDVQEWLCSDDDYIPQANSEQPVNGQGANSAQVAEANKALVGKEPANDDEMIDMGDGKKYPRSLLERKLGL